MTLAYVLKSIEALKKELENAKNVGNVARYNYFAKLLRNEYDKAKNLDPINGQQYSKLKEEVTDITQIDIIKNNIINKPSGQPTGKPAPSSKGGVNNGKINNQSNSEEDSMWQAEDIPDISFDDVAGLDDVKESIRMRVILPILRPDVYQKFKKKSGGGILLYGPPGTGKTMIAKAIAHETKAKFYSVKCSDIVSKWFGESEQKIKSLFETARKDENAIIFFDEFESLASKRTSDSNSAMNRIVPELLAEMQGFSESKNNLLLLAATNRPWDIDSALMRPGRFNEKIYIDLPDAPARKYIIDKKLKDIPMEDDVDINYIVKITEGYNAADVGEFCERLKDNPIRKSIAATDGTYFKVTNEDVVYAKNKVKTSVQKEDIDKLNKFRQEYDKA